MRLTVGLGGCEVFNGDDDDDDNDVEVREDERISKDLVYSGRINEGDRFVFDRRAGRATIDGRAVFKHDEASVRKYRVYFDRR